MNSDESSLSSTENFDESYDSEENMSVSGTESENSGRSENLSPTRGNRRRKTQGSSKRSKK